MSSIKFDLVRSIERQYDGEEFISLTITPSVPEELINDFMQGDDEDWDGVWEVVDDSDPRPQEFTFRNTKYTAHVSQDGTNINYDTGDTGLWEINGVTRDENGVAQ